MEKIILIGTNNNFSVKVNRWLFPITGFVFLAMGTRHIYRYQASNNDDHQIMILALMMIIIGLYYIFFGFTAFYANSKLALKINISDEFITIRNKYLKAAVKMNWEEINRIEFGDRKISFQVDAATRKFTYQSNADVSKEIKSEIRKMAEQKNIDIISG